MTNSKQKGNRFERVVAKLLSEWSGIELRRTPMSGGFAKGSTSYVGDINAVNREDIFRYNVECKSYGSKSWKLEQLFNDGNIIDKWWQQCIDDSKSSNRTPLLIFTKNNDKNYVMVLKKDLPKKIKRFFTWEDRSICLLDEFLKVKYKGV